MRKTAIYTALVACLLGIFLSILSVNNHFRLAKKGFSEQSYCSINEFVNCDLVSASSYSEVFSVPVSWWGLTFYLLAAIFLLLCLLKEQRAKSRLAFAGLLAAFSVLYSIRMAYVLFFVLNVFCIECVGMYVANLIIFASIFFANSESFKKLKSSLSFKNLLNYGALSLLFFAISWGVIKQVQASGKKGVSRASVAEKVDAHFRGSLYDMKVDDRWAVWGNPQGKVAVVVFFDFQCSHCRSAAINIKPYLHEFKDDVQFRRANFVLRHFPYSRLAAEASVCLQEDDSFEAFHDEVFLNQRSLNEAKIYEYANQLGWNKQRLDECLAKAETKQRVEDDMAEARRLRFTGTPVVIINGRKARYWKDGKFLQEVIKQELKRSK